MVYAPLNTVGWPEWFLRKSCSVHKTASPGSGRDDGPRQHAIALEHVSLALHRRQRGRVLDGGEVTLAALEPGVGGFVL